MDQSPEWLADMMSLTNIEGAYGPTYDGRRGSEWADMFTEDGIYQARVMNGQAGNFIRGRANLQKFCDEQPWQGIHYMMTPQFEISGDTAVGRIHFQYRAVGVTGDRVAIRNSSGAYDVSYVKVEGTWRMQRRITSFHAESRDVFHGWYPTLADLDEPWPYGDDSYVDRRE